MKGENMKTSLDESMLAYRKEHFAVEIGKPHHPLEQDEISMTITTNGSNYTTVHLLQSEIPKVIAALQAALKS